MTAVTLEIGKLYVSDEYYLLMFPEMSFAEHYHYDTWHMLHVTPSSAAGQAKYVSVNDGITVSFVEPSAPLLILSVCPYGRSAQVLAGDRVGWISNNWRLKFKELE